MNISKLMMSTTVIIVAFWGGAAYAVTSSDEDIQVLNVDVSASNPPFEHTLDPIKGLKPGMVNGGVVLARGYIKGTEPQQYAVKFDSPAGNGTAIFSGEYDRRNELKVLLSPVNTSDFFFWDGWLVFPVGLTSSYEVQKYTGTKVNADVYKIIVYAVVYTP